jgi:isoamylase
VIRLRRRYRLLRSGSFLHGETIDDKGTRNVVWYRPDGQEMDDTAWTDPQAKVVGVLLCDATTRLMILVNPYHEPIDFKLPGANLAAAWQLRIDAGSGAIDPPDRRFAAEQSIRLEGRSLLLLAGETG